MSKVISAADAAALVKDGDTVGFAALILAGWPEETAIGLEKRFLETGHPAGLTVVHASGVGDWATKGTEHFAHPGMVRCWMGGHTGVSPDMAKMVLEGGCKGYCIPQGVVAQLWREIAAHRPGLITKTGIHTFVDPRVEGGRLNKETTEDFVKVISVASEEWLFYPSFKVDVAIIRGTTADERGNLTVEDEGALLESLPLAQAAKNSGGIVIAEVEYLAAADTLNPKSVRVPGVVVDHVVISGPGHHWQAGATAFNPAFAGILRIPQAAVPRPPFNERLIMARRAAMELTPGAAVNLGIGVPEGVAAVAAEEGCADMITLTTEIGAIGGVPQGGKDFGMSVNMEAFVEEHVQFDWYSGGGLDFTFLSAAQVDVAGNVNVSKFGGKFVGVGGFIDISQHAKRVVYCGTFTTGGLRISIDGEKLVILQEGKARKYVRKVEQISFSGTYAAKTRQPVLFVTERAVFELQDGQVTLIEIAPGVDVEEDILAHMEFKPRISPNLKSMPVEIFRPSWGGLRKLLDSKVHRNLEATHRSSEER